MNVVTGIFIGIGSALVIAIFVYFLYSYLKINVHHTKIKNTLAQIRGQVDIKYDLLKQYIELNKDSINEDRYIDFNNVLNLYKNSNEIDVESLKDFNISCNYYLKSFQDTLLIKQCDESEEKIEHIKDYYNELVCFFNRLKSNGFNSFLARAMSIKDEKLY